MNKIILNDISHVERKNFCNKLVETDYEILLITGMELTMEILNVIN